MKYFKRILTLLLALVLAANMALPACAAETGSISASAGAIKDGSVSVTVSVKDNPGFAALKLELSFDTSKLTFSSAEKGIFDTNFNIYKLPDGKVNLLWDKSNGDASGDGTLTTLSFKVKSGATGSANVSLRFVEANNWDFAKLQLGASGCAVQITEGGTTGGGTTGGGGGGGGGMAAQTKNDITIASMSNGSVKADASSAEAGDTVTLTVMPSNGYELSNLSVKTKSGTEIATMVRGGAYTFTMPKEAVTVSAAFAEKSTGIKRVLYDDVEPARWFYDAVMYVSDKGLMNGVEERLFKPNADTTRSMVITILARMDGVETLGGKPWYAKAVDWAKAKDISDGENPTGVITREQLATMLYRFAQYKGFNTSSKSALTDFSDASSVHAWAEEAMQWAVGTGLINGIDGALVPRGNTSRAQLATMLMRLCQKYSI